MIKVHDYQCTDCGHVFEKFVSHGGTHHECPLCGSGKTETIVVSPSFKVTGQGQYTTKMKV